MIKGLLFDLDGTLVQTEALKAKSYAEAAVKLNPKLAEQAVIEAFKDVVGQSREVVSDTLMKRFGLEDVARKKMETYGVDNPWQAYAEVRMEIYNALIADPNVIDEHLCRHNIRLLKWAKEKGFALALATQSHREQADKILEMLKLTEYFAFVATREDVKNPKPDPEIYFLLAKKLEIAPEESLVIEDSATGVESALAAGMGCIAVTSEFTRKSVHQLKNFDKRWIVDVPSDVLHVVKLYITRKKY